jgi:hypothetical protein
MMTNFLFFLAILFQNGPANASALDVAKRLGCLVRYHGVTKADFLRSGVSEFSGEINYAGDGRKGTPGARMKIQLFDADDSYGFQSLDFLERAFGLTFKFDFRGSFVPKDKTLPGRGSLVLRIFDVEKTELAHGDYSVRGVLAGSIAALTIMLPKDLLAYQIRKAQRGESWIFTHVKMQCNEMTPQGSH